MFDGAVAFVRRAFTLRERFLESRSIWRTKRGERGDAVLLPLAAPVLPLEP